MLPIDIESLDPAQRMELADVLYDSAMQAIDDAQGPTPEQAALLDERLARLADGRADLLAWDAAFGRDRQDL